MHLNEEERPLLSGGNSSLTQYVPLAKSFDAGTVGPADYGAVSGYKANEIEEASGATGSENVPQSRRKRVIIVGAGVSGIQQAAIILKDGEVKRDDLQIFDALDDFGGTWLKNSYPGCACDVPAMVYTTSFEINKEYTHYFATREEIQDYYKRFADKYELKRSTQFGKFVKTCTWSDEDMIWNVGVQDKVTGILEHWIADVVIQCVGALDRPKFGNTPGRSNYKGTSWHTAHWRFDYDLTGKNVAVVGCGPSAAQIIPEIVDKTKSLSVYMRTPPVCTARGDFAYSRLFRWALKWVPLFAWLQRFWECNEMGASVAMSTDNDPLNDSMTKAAIDYMESEIKDPKLREILRPHSKYFCKRPLRLDNFYSSLAKPHVTTLRDNLIRYTEEGIVSADCKTGVETERKFDVIIYGTGFNTSKHLEHERITGINGQDLQKKWEEHPEALYGLATNGFPNMFMCFGPNSATLWSSQQDNWEQQARFNSKVVAEMARRERKGRKLAIHPARDVEHAYNLELQKRQNGVFVWARRDCVTYYKNDAGWITYTMPWTGWQFKNMLRKIRWHEWISIEKPLVTNRFVPATMFGS